jgi:hypothetical protein
MSSIAPLLKSIAKASLPSMTYEKKEAMLQSLQKEHSRLLDLEKKEEQIISKYKAIMEKLSAKQPPDMNTSEPSA